MSNQTNYTRKIDVEIGRRVQEARLCNGLSRAQLASKIGVTHQQLQKNEKGDNRISVGRLSLIAKTLRKPISSFFEDLEEKEIFLPDSHTRLCLETTKNLMKIKNEKKMKIVNLLAKSLAEDI